jgi:hypothetical protein
MDMDQLREEIQTDRIEIQRSINHGFDRIDIKLDSLVEKQANFDKRLVVVEKTQGTIINTVVGVISVGFTAVVGWVVSVFTGKH